MESTRQETAHERTRWWRFAPLAVVVVGLVVGYTLGLQRYLSLMYLAESQETLKGYVAENRVLSLAGFGVIYALAVAFSFPAATILTIFAGFLFGCFAGGSVVAVAATTGATAIFLVARSAFGEGLTRKVGGKAAKLAEGFEKNAFGYLLFLRLAPVFPFFIVNIAPALFNIKVRTYVAATFLGILPGTFAYTYLGEGIGGVLDTARQTGVAPSVKHLLTPKIQIAFLMLALIALLPIIVRRLRGSK